jgi:hypothetical protein
VDASHAKRVREAAFTTLGARAGLRLGDATLSLELMNLGRAQALDASGMPMPGPQAVLGVTWRGR